MAFICYDCFCLTGKTDNSLTKNARYYDSSCDVCHRKKPVLSAQDCNFFTPDQIAQAKSKLRELGLDKRTFANPGDVKTLVGVVTDVLGDYKSETTKELLKHITDKLAKGESIEMYYTKQLTQCFAQDAAIMKARKEQETGKKKKRGKKE